MKAFPPGIIRKIVHVKGGRGTMIGGTLFLSSDEVNMRRLIFACIGAVWLLQVVSVNQANAKALLPFQKTVPPHVLNVPWNQLEEQTAGLVKTLLDKANVQARGPSETFTCVPEQYHWLLDNPDRAVTAWRRIGAKCVSILPRGPGRFGYADESGSDISWQTIHRSPGVRIWFAEGKVKPNAVLPLVPVKALVVLHYIEGKNPNGHTTIRHHAEVAIVTDSRAAAAVTKMMGQSAPRLAEQGLSQVQMFFAALSCYVDRHPDQAEALFRPENTGAIQRVNKTGQ